MLIYFKLILQSLWFFSKACLYLGLFVFLGLAGAPAPAPFRSDGKVPLRSGAPGLQFLLRVGVFNIKKIDRGW